MIYQIGLDNFRVSWDTDFTASDGAGAHQSVAPFLVSAPTRCGRLALLQAHYACSAVVDVAAQLLPGTWDRVAQSLAMPRARTAVQRRRDDFLFQLTLGEADAMRSQIATASPGRRNIRFRPFAFTEHGVTMLSAVLRSPQAMAVSVAVVRAFVRLRHAIAGHAELAHRVDALERRYDGKFKAVFDALRQVLEPAPAERPRIGFNRDA